VLRALGEPSLLVLVLVLVLVAAAAAAGWLAGRKHAAPEHRECTRSRRSGHIDALNEEDLQPKKHTMQEHGKRSICHATTEAPVVTRADARRPKV
jgi:hypothetical protein